MRRRALSAALVAAAIAACAPPRPPLPPPAPPEVEPPPAGRSYRSAGPPALVPQLGFEIRFAEPSPDGVLLATTSQDERAVQIWDVDRRVIVAELDGAHGFSRAIAWTADGRFLHARGSRGITVWSARTGRRVAQARGRASALIERPATLAELTDDGKALLVTPLDDPSRRTTVELGAAFTEVAPAGPAFALRGEGRTDVIAPDGHTVASFASGDELEPSADGTLALLGSDLVGVADGKPLMKVTRSYGAAWSPVGHDLAYMFGSELHLVAPEQRADVAVMKDVDAFAWSPDGARVVLLTRSKELVTIDRRGGAPRSIGNAGVSTRDFTWSSSGREVILGWRSDAEVWDLDAGRLVGKLPKRECRFLAGKDAVVCPLDDADRHRTVLGFVTLGGTAPATTVPALRKLGAEYRWREREDALEITCPNGGVAVLGADDAAAPEIRRRAEIRVAATAAAPRHARVVEAEHGLAVSARGAVDVWDWATGARRFHVTLPDEAEAIAWSSNGSLLVATSADGTATTALILDARTGAVLRTLDQGHDLSTLDVHPTRPLVVTGSWMPPGGTYVANEKSDVMVWDAVTGKRLKKLRGERAWWSPDGKLLAASRSSAVDIWDVASWRRLSTVSGTAMYALWSPDGRRVLTPLVDTSFAYHGLYEENGLEVRDARTAAVLFKIPVKAGNVGWSPFGGRIAVGESASRQENHLGLALDVSVWNVATRGRELTIPSSFPVDDLAFWQQARVLAAWTRGLLRLTRLSDRRTLWIGAADGPQGACRAGVFDEAGRFDGDLDDLFAARLGDDLRESAVEPRGTPHPGLFRELLEGR